MLFLEVCAWTRLPVKRKKFLKLNEDARSGGISCPEIISG